MITGIGLITKGDGIVGVGDSLEPHHYGAVASGSRVFTNGDRRRTSGIGRHTNGDAVNSCRFCISTNSNRSFGGIGISANGCGFETICFAVRPNRGGVIPIGSGVLPKAHRIDALMGAAADVLDSDCVVGR